MVHLNKLMYKQKQILQLYESIMSGFPDILSFFTFFKQKTLFLNAHNQSLTIFDRYDQVFSIYVQVLVGIFLLFCSIVYGNEWVLKLIICHHLKRSNYTIYKISEKYCWCKTRKVMLKNIG